MSSQHPTSTASIRAIPSRRKWFIDLQIRKNERLPNTSNENTSTTMSTTNNNKLLVSPIGYSDQRVADLLIQEDDERLLAKRSWDIALQPIKQLPMNVILAWMAGNTFSLMSIMIVVMLFMKPIQAIFSLSSAFSSLEQEGLVGNIWLHKIMYFLGNLTHLALALYKCQSMGLLPTYNSDWIAFAGQQTRMEMSLGGTSYS
ncbi:unnamed protein product [Rotaria magnacalcarata]|uniref:ER membrane protein complex subunit 4 n=1 Tax=Rotaria magnacalcarata TaxID=392030 RepID=A0A816T2R6_9BILA|nr:unnamed protein product [Rotaria magnacalcarata]CAF1618849.1 unnamed protein product [Rotaria magnacalcarata]CAF2092047.1 unnamed protein product [Rotaria magnacalcarata]CAF2113154.1 unnamed protein product [Rotaria magnacalcarata]CAF2207309.1 unnamed protein product [Rotaria magnacalcarata]